MKLTHKQQILGRLMEEISAQAFLLLEGKDFDSPIDLVKEAVQKTELAYFNNVKPLTSC